MKYDIDSIQSWDFREGVRNRVQMYLGSDNTEGIYQGFKEIINNSTDEAICGFGNEIEITLSEQENRISVRDYGRGVPFGIRENGENVLVSIYTNSHTGGKLEKGAYKNSSGLNGVGGSATCLSSKEFLVESYRDGKSATAAFKEGILQEYKEKSTKEKNGTFISFIPDKKVFAEMEEGYTFSRVASEIKNISYLNKGIKFIVIDKDNNNKEVFYSENGIGDYIRDKVSKPLMKQPIICTASDGTDEVEIAFIWSGKEAGQGYVFVNGLYCPEGGSPITGAKSSITQQMKKLSKKEFDADVIRKGLIYAINCKVNNPSFEGQTKNKVNNANLRTLASQAFKEGLEMFAQTPEFTSIIEMINKFQKAEKAAERARKQVMETAREIEKNQNKKVFNSDKLKDAEFLGQDSTLLIVEGDSAAGAIANARDYKKYGILAIRGKILNPLDNTEERIAQNDEITLILKALNIVPGKYNPKKLRYGRVAICSDADSDGYHIGLLVMAVLHYIAPEFIQENRLGWLRSPLFIVKNGKNESYYFTDEEFNKVRETIKGEVQRCKGLGALEPEQANRSMFTDEFQKIDILNPSDEAIELLENLMGDDASFRKNYIFNNIDFSEIRE